MNRWIQHFLDPLGPEFRVTGVNESLDVIGHLTYVDEEPLMQFFCLVIMEPVATSVGSLYELPFSTSI